MKENSILWADGEHIRALFYYFVGLRQAGIEVIELNSVIPEKILENIEEQEVVIIHSGTLKTIPQLSQLLRDIKLKRPDIKIGLQTNAIPLGIEDLIDFAVPLENFSGTVDDFV